jgi:CRISPR/Cas system-associated exonuclease Cas4 (RecB family)
MVKQPIKTTKMISKAAVDLMIKYCVGGRSVYEKRYQKPYLTAEDKGVNIGISYDLGSVTEKQFFSDWDGLNLNFLHALRKVVGIKGEAVKPMLRGEILQVRIPYNFAYDVFVTKSLPKYYKMTKAIYPEIDSLNEDTRGALVSMVYNRGNKIEGDTRKEMRAIVDLVAKQDYEGIADQIERSKRLWENSLDGLVKRREEEADLILNSIA